MGGLGTVDVDPASVSVQDGHENSVESEAHDGHDASLSESVPSATWTAPKRRRRAAHSALCQSKGRTVLYLILSWSTAKQKVETSPPSFGIMSMQYESSECLFLISGRVQSRNGCEGTHPFSKP